MWKCDYKLLKAQKQTVNRSHHENVVVWNIFISMTLSNIVVIVLTHELLSHELTNTSDSTEKPVSNIDARYFRVLFRHGLII